MQIIKNDVPFLAHLIDHPNDLPDYPDSFYWRLDSIYVILYNLLLPAEYINSPYSCLNEYRELIVNHHNKHHIIHIINRDILLPKANICRKIANMQMGPFGNISFLKPFITDILLLAHLPMLYNLGPIRSNFYGLDKLIQDHHADAITYADTIQQYLLAPYPIEGIQS